MKTLGIIQARVESRRLPGKVLRRLGPWPLIQWVVHRVLRAGTLDQVVVATADTPEDRQLDRWLPPHVPLVVGPARDVLARFIVALDRFPAEGVVRICADNPFIDPDLIDALVREAQEAGPADYVSFRRRNGRPAVLTGLGLTAEWTGADALRDAHATARHEAEWEHVTPRLYQHPQQYRCRWLSLPEPLDRDDLRLTVDFPQDWRHVEQVYRELQTSDRPDGGMPDFGWRDIAAYLQTQPQICRQMQLLNWLCPKELPQPDGAVSYGSASGRSVLVSRR